MIIIVSEESDSSTNGVIDWLFFYKKPYVRINVEDILSNMSVEIVDLASIIKLKEYEYKKANAVWYRRGAISINVPKNEKPDDSNDFSNKIIRYLNKELFIASNYILRSNVFADKCIGNYDVTLNINKLFVLEYAIKNKLKIPATLLTNSKTDLSRFFTKYKKVVTKALFEAPIFSNKDNDFFFYTSQVDDITDIPQEFFPSLFQEMVDKAFEVRVFFVKNNYFSMAIFSQNDETTSVDFRNYNRKRPNRTVPYKLPRIINKRLKNLMNDLKLNTGSIDLVVDKNGEFFFLEVNPVGQYGMVSYPCNYNLDKVVASELIKL